PADSLPRRGEARPPPGRRGRRYYANQAIGASRRRAVGRRRSGSRVDREAFAATALAGRVRIAEHERGIQALATEVDLGAVDERQRLAIDDEAQAVLVEHGVVGVDRLREVDRVAEARAAGAA